MLLLRPARNPIAFEEIRCRPRHPPLLSPRQFHVIPENRGAIYLESSVPFRQHHAAANAETNSSRSSLDGCENPAVLRVSEGTRAHDDFIAVLAKRLARRNGDVAALDLEAPVAERL
jgi:hypothetical protein